METFSIGKSQLVIDKSGIRWENKLLDNSINRPTEFRYGTIPIEVDMFTIGTKYKIELRDSEKTKFSISIKSYFGIGIDKKFKMFQKITVTIWNYFFIDPFSEIINQFEQGRKITVDKFEINNKGLTRKVGNRGIKLDFDEMELLQRIDHLLINSVNEPNKYIKLSYLEDWNWPIIQEILFKRINTVANNGEHAGPR